jgi:hypothetical protein
MLLGAEVDIREPEQREQAAAGIRGPQEKGQPNARGHDLPRASPGADGGARAGNENRPKPRLSFGLTIAGSFVGRLILGATNVIVKIAKKIVLKDGGFIC